MTSAALDEIKILECQQISEKRGELFIIDIERMVPFELKRGFFMYDVPSDITRGQHAHYRCRQFLVCQKGRLLVTVTDGAATRRIELCAGQAVLIEPLIFSEQTYLEQGSMLLVLCDRLYEEDDYIRDVETLRAYLKRSDDVA
jgi:dTDP-4-dehydrorhamnose 3,5-epimerase-like enzyme